MDPIRLLGNRSRRSRAALCPAPVPNRDQAVQEPVVSREPGWGSGDAENGLVRSKQEDVHQVVKLVLMPASIG
jgi:hypothetical protein